MQLKPLDGAPPARAASAVAPSILAAALALPGLAVAPAVQAQVTLPNTTLVQFKYLYYKDGQPSGDRMTVHAPALYLLTPVAQDWVLEVGAVVDSLSGASPVYHTTLSGASGKGIEDRRTAGDVTVTRYFDRTAVSARVAYSTEDDYRSRAGGVTVRHASDDQNTTLTLGVGGASDDIFPTDGPRFTKSKRTVEAVAGVTQVLTRRDLVQANLWMSRQSGYLSDPYKAYWGLDQRPDTRTMWALLGRWNHALEPLDATLRTTYRYYQDSWKIGAHTVTAEWAQDLPGAWTLTPNLRYSTQSAAEFYYDPVYDALLGAPYPPGFLNNPNGHYSSDQRLSAFGAITAGVKVAKAFAGGWSVDASAQAYQQRAGWRIGGNGSPGLENFNAQFYTVGVNRRF